jgi:hypothetical protein
MGRLRDSVLAQAVTSSFPVSEAAIAALGVLAAEDAVELAGADGNVTV